MAIPAHAGGNPLPRLEQQGNPFGGTNLSNRIRKGSCKLEQAKVGDVITKQRNTLESDVVRSEAILNRTCYLRSSPHIPLEYGDAYKAKHFQPILCMKPPPREASDHDSQWPCTVYIDPTCQDSECAETHFS